MNSLSKRRFSSVDPRCPLFRDFYTPRSAREAIAENRDWAVFYGQETIDAGLALAQSREEERILGGYQARSWLSEHFSSSSLSSRAKWAADLYFTDSWGVENEERVYDFLRNNITKTKDIKEALFEAMRPLHRDLFVWLYPGEDRYPLCSTRRVSGGTKITLPLGTKIFWFDGMGDEILLPPDSRVIHSRLEGTSALSNKLGAEVEEDGSFILLQE